MDLVRMQTALLERDIRLGPSLWALTGSPPPGEDTWARIAEQQDMPAAPPEPAASAAPAAEPVVEPVVQDDQLSLF